MENTVYIWEILSKIYQATSEPYGLGGINSDIRLDYQQHDNKETPEQSTQKTIWQWKSFFYIVISSNIFN